MRDSKKKWKLWQGISLNVILLGVVSFLTDVSSEMIHPLLPMFIVALGGGGMAIGLIGGLGDSLSSILKVFAPQYGSMFSSSDQPKGLARVLEQPLEMP